MVQTRMCRAELEERGLKVGRLKWQLGTAEGLLGGGSSKNKGREAANRESFR